MSSSSTHPLFEQVKLFLAVPHLQGHTAPRNPVRSVDHARRPARVHAGGERALLAEVYQLAIEDPHLFPEVVGNRIGRLDAGREADETCYVAARRVAAQDLLLDARAARTADRRGGGHGLPRQVVWREELNRWF